MLSEDMDQVLRDYFAWSTSNNPADVGYPHSIPTERLRGSSIGSLGISDDEAMWINAGLCRLKETSPDAYSAIERVYRDGKSVRWMHERGEGDRRTIARLLSEGREFIRGVLLGVSITA